MSQPHPPAVERLRRRVRRLTALSALLVCALAALVGYVLATRPAPRPTPAAQALAEALAETPTVQPTDPARARHPTFDCREFEGAFEAPAGPASVRIATLRDTPGGQRVRTRGKVMNAYPRIMGRNWLHLCDAPGGDVLVVATTDWAHPGDAVTVEGVLSHDRDIGGVYRFPLLIEGGALEGPGVVEQGRMPPPVIDL